jgi:hypothetical protein
MPKLPVTVPLEVYGSVKAICGEPFADSYLSGAVIEDGRLIPRTQIAWERLCQSHGAKAALRQHKVSLVKPPPYDAANDRLPHTGAAA